MLRRTGFITLVAFVAGLLLGSPLGATPTATKKAIRIDTDTRGGEHCTGKFFLQLGIGGDLGKVECTRAEGAGYKKTSEGLEYLPSTERITCIGKAGTFVLRAVGGTYDVGFGLSKSASGTWSIVSGTGTYAGMQGHGRWVGVHTSTTSSDQSRYAGFVTLTS